MESIIADGSIVLFILLSNFILKTTTFHVFFKALVGCNFFFAHNFYFFFLMFFVSLNKVFTFFIIITHLNLMQRAIAFIEQLTLLAHVLTFRLITEEIFLFLPLISHLINPFCSYCTESLHLIPHPHPHPYERVWSYTL